MILEDLTVPRAEFEARTGWRLRPEGACKGDVCVPIAQPPDGDVVDVRSVARDLGLPLAEAPDHSLWALGPECFNARALTTAQAPDLVLPDLEGVPFELSTLRGTKVLLYAWAPY